MCVDSSCLLTDNALPIEDVPNNEAAPLICTPHYHLVLFVVENFLKLCKIIDVIFFCCNSFYSQFSCPGALYSAFIQYGAKF